MRKAAFSLTTVCFILVLVILVAASLPSWAQQEPSQQDLNQQLLNRIQELEKRVQALKVQPPTAAAPAPAPEPVPVAEPPEVNEVSPRLKLNFFGDVGYQTGRFYSPTSTFEIGEFDLFATARLSDHVSTLGEVLFTTNADNTIGVDVERLLLKYRPNDYFTASIGRIHTAIGYYNTAYHRGDYFQTSIGRPAMYEFDDQGGFLPMQDLGIVLEGKIPSGKAGLNYVFEVTNGRAYGAGVQPAQNSFDGNNSKAVNVNISAKPEKVPGLDVGFSVRHDYLTDVHNLQVSETIPVVYAVYNNSKYEWLNEALMVRHVVPSGTVSTTTGFYSLVSRKFGDFRPYFLYSYVNAPLDDPILGDATEMPIVGRINGPSIGLRYDFNPHADVKVQYQREDAAGDQPVNGAAVQFAFTF